MRYNGGNERMTGATLTRPPVRHRQEDLPMLNQSTTPPIFGDSRLPARFWAKVNPNGSIPAHRPDLGPCWLWTACLDGHGYGRFSVGSRRRIGTRKPARAYRWAYEHLIGPLSPGLEPDHLCRNPACIRPTHVEPVTHRENVLRGNSAAAGHARKTHCPQGHPYDEANTYRDRKGRKCRACDAARSRQRRRAVASQ